MADDTRSPLLRANAHDGRGDSEALSLADMIAARARVAASPDEWRAVERAARRIAYIARQRGASND